MSGAHQPAHAHAPSAQGGEGDTSSYESASEGDLQGQEQQQQHQEEQGQQHEGGTAKGLLKHGCAHYRRRCKLVSPCCGAVVWCRHCHNAEKHDEEQDPERQHLLDRKAVKEVVCALCDLRQPVGSTCLRCKVAFGRYTCLACRFFDDDIAKKQFHCDKCGICRVGGKENYFHCDTCACCYAVQLRESHVCIENSMHSNCAVCCDYLFDTIKPVCVMLCGHTIHQECLHGLQEASMYCCPTCNKNYLGQAAMERLWNAMDAAVRDTPMPPEYRDMQVAVLCNNCSARSQVPFHVVGHKCSGCGGYNTQRV